MVEINLTKGKALISDVYPYGVRRKAEAALFDGVDFGATTEGVKVPAVNTARSQQIVLLGMLKKLEWDGKSYEPVTEEALDSLPSAEVDAIIRAVNEVTGRIPPKV